MHAQDPAPKPKPDCSIYYTGMESPLGPLLLTSDGVSLTGLYMSEHRYGPSAGEPLSEWGIPAMPGKKQRWMHDDDAPPFAQVKEQLAAYFEGRLTEFDLPLSMEGTEFQQRV